MTQVDPKLAEIDPELAQVGPKSAPSWHQSGGKLLTVEFKIA